MYLVDISIKYKLAVKTNHISVVRCILYFGGKVRWTPNQFSFCFNRGLMLCCQRSQSWDYLIHKYFHTSASYLFWNQISSMFRWKYDFRQISTFFLLFMRAVCAECDANLIRNSEEICFQRHFSRAAPTLEKARLQVLRQSQLFPNSFHTIFWNPKIFKVRFSIICFDGIAWRWSRSSSLQCNCRSLCFGVSFHGSRLFAIFFARMCIDPVTS